MRTFKENKHRVVVETIKSVTYEFHSDSIRDAVKSVKQKHPSTDGVVSWDRLLFVYLESGPYHAAFRFPLTEKERSFNAKQDFSWYAFDRGNVSTWPRFDTDVLFLIRDIEKYQLCLGKLKDINGDIFWQDRLNKDRVPLKCVAFWMPITMPRF